MITETSFRIVAFKEVRQQIPDLEGKIRAKQNFQNYCHLKLRKENKNHLHISNKN
jgi:hypothetical protein